MKSKTTPSIWSGSRAYWFCQAVGWTGAWVMGLVGSLGDDFRLIELANNTVCIGSIFFGSVCLRAVILQMKWKELAVEKLIPRLLICISAFSVIHAAGFYGLSVVLPNFYKSAPQGLDVLMSFFICAMMLLTWSALYFGYQIHERLQKAQLDKIRAEAAQREAEHRALRAQVDPHFLFNSLNTIRQLILENPESAREAVTDLSRLFRRSLSCGTSPLIPFREELEMVEAFLTLEKKRHEDRLQIQTEIDPLSLNHPVPPFLLQTLVENAVKHGISLRVAGGELSYSAQLHQNQLRLRVTNPGRLDFTNGTNARGLANTRERLKLLFGSSASLQLRQALPDLVVAEVTLGKA